MCRRKAQPQKDEGARDLCRTVWQLGIRLRQVSNVHQLEGRHQYPQLPPKGRAKKAVNKRFHLSNASPTARLSRRERGPGCGIACDSEIKMRKVLSAFLPNTSQKTFCAHRSCQST